jgi:hypothetical protein
VRAVVYFETAFIVSFNVLAKANGSCLRPSLSSDLSSFLKLLLIEIETPNKNRPAEVGL